MFKKVLSQRVTFLVLALVLSVASIVAADHWAYGKPCFAERLLFYSDASHTSLVGGDEIICDVGRHVWGQSTDHWVYQFQGPCCSYCERGSCGIEP